VTTRLELTATYTTVENGWVQVQIRELPAVITVAPTIDEARDMLLDALREYFLSLGQGAETEPLPEEAHSESVEVSLTV
jgi:predicted RNase H-like HicB family nuclease